MAGVVINIDSRIGLGAILIQSAASIMIICYLNSGAHLAGGRTLGDLGWVSISVCIRPMIHVGARVIGASAVVVKSVADGTTAVGVSARFLASAG